MKCAIVILVLLGYVAAKERLNPNRDEAHSDLDALQCSRCQIFIDQFGNQYISKDGRIYTAVRAESRSSAPRDPANAYTQGGNGATGGIDGTNAASNKGTTAETNRETNRGTNRGTNDGLNRGKNAAGIAAPRPQSDNPLYKFHQKLFRTVAPSNSQRNLIYSPMSLNILLAMLYIGANQNTATELQRTLELPANRDQCAREFQQTLNTERIEGDAQLLLANKMYYNKALQLKSGVNRFAQSYFNAEVEPINFAKMPAAANNINQWVAEHTQQHIQNIIAPYSLDARTSAILLNAIYFKAKWARPFSTSDSRKGDFFVTPDYKVPVDMMNTEDVFPYAELDDLQAAALNMPFKDTSLSMLVVLPYEKNGLRAVEERLSNMQLTTVMAKMKNSYMAVGLPKFSIEYEQDMVEPLIITGINELFTSHANLTSFFQGPDQPSISKVQHKAFINVNEAGAEAAAASFAKFTPLSMHPTPISFSADHPFMFIIHSPQAVYFAGHVVNF